MTVQKRRASTSKRTRFSIFERDAFTCRYCGMKPPEVVLEIDHVVPLSSGGEDIAENLVTSCVDCNRGKSARVLGSDCPSQDAACSLERVSQEIAEVKRYLEAKRFQEQLIDSLYREFVDLFCSNAPSGAIVPNKGTWVAWINKYEFEEVDFAVSQTRDMCRHYELDLCGDGFIRYMVGVMRNRKKKKDLAEAGEGIEGAVDGQ